MSTTTAPAHLPRVGDFIQYWSGLSLKQGWVTGVYYGGKDTVGGEDWYITHDAPDIGSHRRASAVEILHRAKDE